MRRMVVVAALCAAGIAPTAVGAQAVPRAVASWTTDAMPIAEGAILTILIDELTVATADRDERNSRQRGRDVSVQAGSGRTPSLGGGLRTINDVSDRTIGTASRRERFTAELSARVVEVLPNDVVRIEGSKRVRIDRHEQEVLVRGLVRVQDISPGYTVDSWDIADAELVYDSNEELGRTGGIWSTLLNWIIP